jgi:hypothetical protein
MLLTNFENCGLSLFTSVPKVILTSLPPQTSKEFSGRETGLSRSEEPRTGAPPLLLAPLQPLWMKPHSSMLGLPWASVEGYTIPSSHCLPTCLAAPGCSFLVVRPSSTYFGAVIEAVYSCSDSMALTQLPQLASESQLIMTSLWFSFWHWCRI